MTTPTELPSASPTTLVQRLPLRLHLEPKIGTGALDGSWGPQSRDLPLELADLVDNFPAALGQVQRVVFSRPDWDTAPRRVRVARGLIKVGSYPHDDTHQVWLSMSPHTMIRLSVTTPEGSSPPRPVPLANRTRPTAADDTLRDDRDANSHWNDDGGSWSSSPPIPSPERI
jgi:hypothetical protein